VADCGLANPRRARSLRLLARQIGLNQVGRGKVALTPGAGNNLGGHAVGIIGDLHAREVA